MPVGGITWRHTFRALRHRNYDCSSGASLSHSSERGCNKLPMSWFVYEITNSKFLLGLGVRRRLRADGVVFHLGGRSLHLYPKRSILVATQICTNALRIFPCGRCVARFASTWFIIIVAAFNGLAMGFDMPAPPGVHGRNDQAVKICSTPSRSQLDSKWRSRSWPVDGGTDDRRCRCGRCVFC